MQAYLIKEQFTDTAVPAAARAFRETFEFLKNAIESESYPPAVADVVGDPQSKPIERLMQMAAVPHASMDQVNQGRRADIRASGAATGAEVFIQQKRIELSGAIASQKQADELIAMISALKPMLLKDDDELHPSNTARTPLKPE